MKSIALAAALAAFATTAVAEVKLEKWQQNALKAVKAEDGVLDARWRNQGANMLWVSMLPNGNRRDGFAEVLCMTLIDAGAPQEALKTVWVYDPATFENGGSPMGMAACR